MSARAAEACAAGLAAQQRGEHDAALGHFRTAVEAAPALLDVRLILAYALAARDARDDAARVLDATPAVDRLTPADARRLIAAAIPLAADRAADAALDVALRDTPRDVALLATRALVAERGDAPSRADDAVARALAIDPTHSAALQIAARLAAARGDWSTARAQLDRAVRAHPTDAHARHQRGLLLLTLGEFADGWRDAEARRALRWHSDAAPPGLAAWQGEPMAGAPLVVWGEQGLGDQVQFARFLPLLAERTRASIVLQVAPALVTLLAPLAPWATIVPLGTPTPPGARHVPMMSLPHLLRLHTARDLGDAPYLPGPVRRGPVGRRRLRLGLCWAGNPRHAHDRARSLPLEAVEALVATIDADWVSLQVGAPETARRDHPTLSTRVASLPAVRDFHDTASHIGTLDGVVSADTAVAHVAAATGCPTYILVPPLPDWRWQHTRVDSPWYGAATLVRRAAGAAWTTCWPSLAARLTLLAAPRAA